MSLTRILRPVVLLVATLPVFISDARCQQVDQFNLAIRRHFRYIDSVRYKDDDSLREENKRLAKTLKDWKREIFSLPDTLDFDWLYIAKSADTKVCFVSWDTRQGGTMIEFATMVFYKDTKGQIHSKMLNGSSDEFENTMVHYDVVQSIMSTDRIFYLAHGFGQGSMALPWQELRAFEISNDSLVSPSIFPDKMSSIFLMFDLHEFGDNETVPVIQITKNGRELKVPIPTESEGFSGKYKGLYWDTRTNEFKYED